MLSIQNIDELPCSRAQARPPSPERPRVALLKCGLPFQVRGIASWVPAVGLCSSRRSMFWTSLCTCSPPSPHFASFLRGHQRGWNTHQLVSPLLGNKRALPSCSHSGMGETDSVDDQSFLVLRRSLKPVFLLYDQGPGEKQRCGPGRYGSLPGSVGRWGLSSSSAVSAQCPLCPSPCK